MHEPVARVLGFAACLVVAGPGAADSARISVDSPAAMESSGRGTLDFTVSRSGETGSAVTLRYRTADGTAIAPGDYTALPSTTLTLAAGQTQATIAVTMVGDAVNEANEFLTLELIGIVSVLGAPASYAAASNFSVGSGPASVIATDVNGDGRPDLAAANSGSDNVSVRLNTTAPGAGTPSYATARTFPAGDGPNSVTAVDVNGDDRADLAVANAGSGTVSVLLNTTAPGATTATFAAARAFAAGTEPRSVTATDVDGDGRADLAVANAGSDSVSVLLNATTAGATTAAFADGGSFTVGSTPSAVTTADVNGDGLADLAVANAGSDTVTVLLNITVPGATGAAYAEATDLAAGSIPRSIAAADINGDGLVDFAVANAGSGSVSVLLNTTSPGAALATFADGGSFVAGSGASSVAGVDADGDGRVDLAAANAGDASVSVLLNATAPGTTLTAFADASRFAAGRGAISVAAPDIDGDGLADLAVANADDNTVSVLLNRPAVFDDSEGTGTIRNDDSSTTPAPFSFVDQADVAPNTVITSAPVTITGIDEPVPIGVAGGSYSIGCTNKFTSRAGTVNNGKTVCVRHTSSTRFSTATDTVLTVGGVSDTFTSTTEAPDSPDSQPDPFTFTDVSNTLLNSPQVSNSVTITGIRDAAPISVAGGQYSLGCSSPFTSAPGTIAAGATVCVYHLSAGVQGVATHTTLTVGGVSDTFTSTTEAPQDLTGTGALGLLDALLGLLAALGAGRGRAHEKIRSRGCPCERTPLKPAPTFPALEW